MNLRKAMFDTVKKLMRENENNILMLADIGAMAFSDLLCEMPERAMNIGIFEDGMVGIAAGLALKGMNPLIYGITPFIAERAMEQIKLDFAYQELNGIFITTGAAYDFSTLGYSHYCPEDAAIIKQIPGVEFVAPGTPEQMKKLLLETVYDGKPTFFRMSDYSNLMECEVEFGQAAVVQEGNNCTVISVSTTLDLVYDTFKEKDVTILYYTTLEPFDSLTLKKYCKNGKVLLCHPEYEGTLTHDILKAVSPVPLRLEELGIPRSILHNYGTKKEKDQFLGFTKDMLKSKYDALLKTL